MAKHRMINTRYWSDTFVADLDSLEKLFFLYLMTNQYTNICGIYEIPMKQVALDTGIDRESLEKVLFPRFEMAGKVYYFNGWIYIKNFLKHQKSSGNVKLGIKNGLKLVPPLVMASIKGIEDTGGTQGGHSLKLEPELELELEPETSGSKKPGDFSLEDEITKLTTDKRLDRNIVGYYFKRRRMDIPTRAVYKKEIARAFAEAKTLKDFSKKKIKAAFDYAEENYPEWTIESVGKVITKI